MIKMGEVRAKEEKAQDTKDILTWIGNYKQNKQWIKDIYASYRLITSRGQVAQYEGADMPRAKGGGHSDHTADEAATLMMQDSLLDSLEHQVRYIEHRQHRITSERHAMAFQLRLQEYDHFQIAQVLGCRQRRVYELLRECAKMIQGGE